MTEFRIIGRSRKKIDALSKTTGAAKYADDISLPRMAFAKLLRSVHPHAHIRSIDLSRALALPGVLAIITGPDLPARFGVLPNNQDETALAIDGGGILGNPRPGVEAGAELPAG